MGNFSKLLKLANFVLADKFAKIEDIIELEHVEKEDEGANDIMTKVSVFTKTKSTTC